MKEKSGCTPGRIGHVFFFPEQSYQALKGKDKGWSIRTNGGFLDRESVAEDSGDSGDNGDDRDSRDSRDDGDDGEEGEEVEAETSGESTHN